MRWEMGACAGRLDWGRGEKGMRRRMAADGEATRWMCGRAASLHRVNLQRVSSIMREMREPCLHRSPAKGSKMLKPEKWHAIFDDDGRVLGFQKALKLIVLGGVDPSIRAEVWEFLLGCYALSSTAEYRRQLRIVRRERYEDLVRECRAMHSSIGTGCLAYVVGSKVMDMRTPSKDNDNMEAVTNCGRPSLSSTNKIGSYSYSNNDREDAYGRKSSSDSAEFVSTRGSKDSAAYGSFCNRPSSGAYDCFDTNPGSQDHESYVSERFIDFPPIPVTNLFQKSESDGMDCEMFDARSSTAQQFDDEHMHSFHIDNNVDLVIESNDARTNSYRPNNCGSGAFGPHTPRNATRMNNVDHSSGIEKKVRISDAPEAASYRGTTSNSSENRVSEWLWTLHRIVVDVVRTDSHLEFYGDTKNIARMSDILAVYAWVDPATGYCQGMSDLLSPFVVLYEDNADAFWCFEMLLRRMRENFQMEGPTGVMKQLQALWKILELTDTEIYEHLSVIGAESLHFAFRMLLVLFRRELTFNEALCMWEMMWAADFDEAIAQQLEENCLEPLVLHLPGNLNIDMKVEAIEDVERNSKGAVALQDDSEPCASNGDRVKTISRHPLCGLTRANFWARHNQLHMGIMSASSRNGEDEMAVFCVAAILIINRQKIVRETRSIDDVIKMFNDNRLKIKVKRCIRMAMKIRKKYKLIRQSNLRWSVQ